MAKDGTQLDLEEAADSSDEADRHSIYVARGLAIDDPTKESGLLSRVSADMIPVAAVEYNTKLTSGDKVDCAACGHPQNHYKGFLLTFESGERTTVGNECGKRDFFRAGTWGKLLSQHERNKKAALYEARQLPVVEAIRATRVKVEDWSKRAVPLAEFLQDFRTLFPNLSEKLHGSRKNDRKLTRITSRTVLTLNAGGERNMYEEELVASLPCPEAFAPGFPNKQFRTIYSGLDHAEVVIGQESTSHPKLESAYASLRRLKGEVRDLHVFYDRARALSNPELWKAIAKWGRTDPTRAGNYQWNGKKFRYSDAEYIYEIQPLKPHEVPAVALGDILAEWPTF